MVADIPLVAAAKEGAVYAAPAGSTLVFRWDPAGEQFIRWTRVGGPVAALAATTGSIVTVLVDGRAIGLAAGDGSLLFDTNAAPGAAPAVADSEGVWGLAGDRSSLVHGAPSGLVDRRVSVAGADRLAASRGGGWVLSLLNISEPPRPD